jgi:hypothetical protein
LLILAGILRFFPLLHVLRISGDHSRQGICRRLRGHFPTGSEEADYGGDAARVTLVRVVSAGSVVR